MPGRFYEKLRKQFRDTQTTKNTITVGLFFKQKELIINGHLSFFKKFQKYSEHNAVIQSACNDNVLVFHSSGIELFF